MEYVIKDNSSGTYFERNVAIGPMFGATKDKAMKFDDDLSATLMMCSHSFAFVMCEVEKV